MKFSFNIKTAFRGAIFINENINNIAFKFIPLIMEVNHEWKGSESYTEK